MTTTAPQWGTTARGSGSERTLSPPSLNTRTFRRSMPGHGRRNCVRQQQRHHCPSTSGTSLLLSAIHFTVSSTLVPLSLSIAPFSSFVLRVDVLPHCRKNNTKYKSERRMRALPYCLSLETSLISTVCRAYPHPSSLRTVYLSVECEREKEETHLSDEP